MAHDALTQAVDTIQLKTEQRITKNPDMQKLLAQPSWTKEDLGKFEKGLNGIVAQETTKIHGFGHYRTIHDTTNHKKAQDITALNQLSSDIQFNREGKRFDCLIQSLVKGAVAQRITDKLLPHNSPSWEWKRASPYFLAAGLTNYISQNGPAFTNHASLLTPSGDMVDGTLTDSRAFIEAAPGSATLEQLAAGQPFVSKHGAIYSYWGTESSPTKVLATWEHHRIGREAFKLSDLEARDGINGQHVLKDPSREFVVVGQDSDSQKKIGLRVYQRQMDGTPLEDYRLVAMEQGKEKRKIAYYKDPLTDKTYFFWFNSSENKGYSLEIRSNEKTLAERTSLKQSPIGIAAVPASKPRTIPAKPVVTTVAYRSPAESSTKPLAQARAQIQRDYSLLKKFRLDERQNRLTRKETLSVQGMLLGKRYDLGRYGLQHNGLDGKDGVLTRNAARYEERRLFQLMNGATI